MFWIMAEKQLHRFKNPKQKEFRVKEEIINLFVKHSNWENSSIFHSITCTLELENDKKCCFSPILYVKSPTWTWKASTRAINETCLFNDVIECEARWVFPLPMQTFTNILCTCIKREKSLWKAFSFFINSFLPSLRWKEREAIPCYYLSNEWFTGGLLGRFYIHNVHAFQQWYAKILCTRVPLKKDVYKKKKAIEITKRNDYSDNPFLSE